MKLPIALSVPHAGLCVPEHLRRNCLLSAEQIAADGDVGARAIYDLREHVERFVTTEVARAVIDMNRAPDDLARADGLVKTETCWREPVWREPLGPDDVQWLLRRYHTPYHRALGRFAGRVRLAVDCHTMAEFGPPIGPDPGVRRPLVCLGHVGGASCPPAWVEMLRDCFVRHFGPDVTIDVPFAGGYVTRRHGLEMPWVQVELSRSDALSVDEKRTAVLASLRDWCAHELPRLAG